MKVKCRRVEKRSGVKKNGEYWAGADVLVCFPDGVTAERLYVPDTICPLDAIEAGKCYDLWRSSNGYVEVFDPIEN